MCLFVLFLLASTNAQSSLSDFKRGYQKFSIELYTQSKGTNGNFLLSPFSAANILTLTSLGAKGATFTEFQNVLHLPQKRADILQSYQSITSNLSVSNVKISNRIYPASFLQISPDFNKTAVGVFNSHVQNLNYNQPAVAAKIINKHVEEDTNGKITNLVKATDLATARIVLVNALYYQGGRPYWTVPFESATPEDFFSGSKTLKVNTMYVTDYLNYQNNSELQAAIVRLTLEDKGVSVHIVVPRDRNGLTKVEENIRRIGYNPKLTPTLVALSLPKFKIESTTDLGDVDVLQKLGLRRAFHNADFSGLFTNKVMNLSISKVIQKTYLKLNEYGIEAAAATDVVVGEGGGGSDASPEPIRVVVDHPFRFFIFVDDIEIFSGRVVNPQEE